MTVATLGINPDRLTIRSDDPALDESRDLDPGAKERFEGWAEEYRRALRKETNVAQLTPQPPEPPPAPTQLAPPPPERSSAPAPPLAHPLAPPSAPTRKPAQPPEPPSAPSRRRSHALATPPA